MSWRLHVVLVRPQYESNIGAASRAMANMGGEKLYLVAPQCEIGYPAQQAAATGQLALRSRKVYGDLTSLQKYEPQGVYVSLTGKDGKMRQVRELEAVIDFLESKWRQAPLEPVQPRNLYLVFGCESSGLTNEELELTHFHATLPVYGTNFSLNLAQAVLLTLFIVQKKLGGTSVPLEGEQPERPAQQPLGALESALREFVLQLGFKIDHRRVNAYSILRRVLLTHVPTAKELEILKVVFIQAARKLKKDLSKKQEL